MRDLTINELKSVSGGKGSLPATFLGVKLSVADQRTLAAVRKIIGRLIRPTKA